jgi:hypothetical protein
VNVSLGAQRVMTLKMKKDGEIRSEDGSRPTQRFPLPHNSMFVMGPETNKKWLHAINHDKRPLSTKSDAERAYNCERISLTFRHIGTFLSADEKKIWGQGATEKTKERAQDVLVGGKESEMLIWAFGRENHESRFDWDRWYGSGSDVLHFTGEEGNQ